VPSRFAELSQYVRFGPDDLANLRAFREVAHPHFAGISAQFYERIREHEDAHAVISSEEQMRRLQASLVRWMERVCTRDRDAAYAAETEKIGHVHVRINLPQRYVHAAMALIHDAFNRIADEAMGARAASVRSSIVRALDIELAVMLESYHEDFVARVQRKADSALARSEHNYENAVELAPYLVVGITRTGTIALFNRAAESTTHYTRDQVLGSNFVATMFAEDPRIEDVIAGQRQHVSLRGTPLRTNVGRMRQVDWEIAHAAHPTEEVVAFAIGRDVTDEIAAAERTRQTEKLAAVGTLAAGLAHEIRNPLNGAHLHVTFLERGLRKSGANAEALEAVQVVGDEIKRLSALVTEFLDFARPKPLERRPVVLQRLCEKVASFVTPTAAPSTVVLDLPTAELTLEADAAKLEQVVLNLVQNGLDAMSSSGGKLTLRLRRQPLHAVLEIQDEGPGLPDPAAPIFDAFYTTKPNGTGLGLAIVHRIVTDHGGSITFESRPGKTCFRIVLPLS
jgi:PAS domain S-box-containing protein